jgi:hypothetical protein
MLQDLRTQQLKTCYFGGSADTHAECEVVRLRSENSGGRRLGALGAHPSRPADPVAARRPRHHPNRAITSESQRACPHHPVVTHDEKIIPTFKRIYHIRDGRTVEETGEGRLVE